MISFHCKEGRCQAFTVLESKTKLFGWSEKSAYYTSSIVKHVVRAAGSNHAESGCSAFVYAQRSVVRRHGSTYNCGASRWSAC